MPLINFSGIASGIDTNALIDATSEAARETRVRPLEEKVDSAEDTNAAFKDFKERAQELKDLVAQLTTLNGGGVSKAANSSDETVVSAIASNSAVNSTYTIDVAQIASNGVGSFDARFASSSALVAPGLVSTGNDVLQIDVGTPPQSLIYVVDATTTWNDIMTAFNSSIDPEVGTAAFVNVGTSTSPSYAFVVTTTETGSGPGAIVFDAQSDILTANPDMTATVNAGTDAEFTINGISGTITKSTNSIADVLTGVTFNIEGTGVATITIDTDVAATTSTIQEIVDTYNELVTFLRENDLVERVEDGEEVENVFGPLAATQIDDNFLTAMRNAISGAQSSTSTAVRIMADLGIKTNRDGTLTFEEENSQTGVGWKVAIESNATAVAEILSSFADTVASTSGTIDQFIRFNGIIDVAVRGNETLIADLRDRIRNAERAIARNEDTLRQRFARLESLIGNLQNQQSALSSALSQLGR